MSENILFLGNKIFEIPPFFQTRPGDHGQKVHACSLRFSAPKGARDFSSAVSGFLHALARAQIPPSPSPFNTGHAG